MKKRITLLAALATTMFGYSQDFGIKFSGYVKGEYQFDSRQVDAGREGNYMTVPMPNVEDAVGEDYYGNVNFNGYAVETRLRADISGPEFFGMQSNAVIEGDFFGTGGSGANGFHLRHGYVELSNDKVAILAGQYWHPMFVTNVSPGVYNFNAGHPFQPFNRSVQLRVSTKGEKMRFIGALVTEMDMKTSGLHPRAAAISGIPAVHAQLQFGQDDKVVFGIGGNMKSVKDDLKGESLTSLAGMAYAKAKLGGVTWKVEGIYGSNMTEQLMFGGYGYDNSGDLISNHTLSLWTEFSGDITESVEWGLFGGFTQDMGFGDDIIAATYSLKLPGLNPSSVDGHTVKNAWRVAPRIGWKSGNTKLGIELDYTSATYGEVDSKGDINKWDDNATVGNFRAMLSLTQRF